MTRFFQFTESQIKYQVLLEEKQMHMSRIEALQPSLPTDLKRFSGYQEHAIFPVPSLSVHQD